PDETEDNILHHESFITKLKYNSVSLNALGFDSEWDFPYHKQIASSILGTWDCRTKNIFNFDNCLKQAQTRVKYAMSHDEIGNIDGTRLITKIIERELKLYNYICDCIQSEKCKKSAHSAQAILETLVSGKLEAMSEDERFEFYKKHNIGQCFPIEQIKAAYKKAIEMHKLAIGKTFSIPGPKMVFQGDEDANIAYFKFFRKFSCGMETCLLDKGYKPGECAFEDSKLCANKYADEYQKIHSSVGLFMSDLNKLSEDNIALGKGSIQNTYVNAMSEIHAIHCKKIYNEIFSVSNFSDITFKNNYGIHFPKGQWREVLNSNDKKYSGSGEYLNKDVICEGFSFISIPPYGITFFEKV
ncbi:alpha amylase C-terminal domain-containing protein, partial [bacterium]|nr:alpha amylase C-terminal domain-containing protein [bacterium]